jgi:hypothetical protein
MFSPEKNFGSCFLSQGYYHQRPHSHKVFKHCLSAAKKNQKNPKSP